MNATVLPYVCTFGDTLKPMLENTFKIARNVDVDGSSWVLQLGQSEEAAKMRNSPSKSTLKISLILTCSHFRLARQISTLSIVLLKYAEKNRERTMARRESPWKYQRRSRPQMLRFLKI